MEAVDFIAVDPGTRVPLPEDFGGAFYRVGAVNLGGVSFRGTQDDKGYCPAESDSDEHDEHAAEGVTGLAVTYPCNEVDESHSEQKQQDDARDDTEDQDADHEIRLD
jgi:hypothetical protein